MSNQNEPERELNYTKYEGRPRYTENVLRIQLCTLVLLAIIFVLQACMVAAHYIRPSSRAPSQPAKVSVQKVQPSAPELPLTPAVPEDDFYDPEDE